MIDTHRRAYQIDRKASMKSKLGTPIYAPLTIKKGSYDTRTDTINYDEVVLDNALVDISMSKNIVKTAIQGRKGTVKEYVSLGDYVINISGSIISDNQKEYPEIEVKALEKIVIAPISLQVVCETLNRLGIYEIVIESYNFPTKQGFIGTQVYSISAISDEPIELNNGEI
ncbi:MAG: hypothetical protein COZ16_05580 [Flavobacteriaceae bacterium CG_4_10_14_3_um_filter_31_253]|nr:MAG: hypothetical protein COZ16_05580 [Flavobacteriaceae bacterium CG_4_10_14_3_um_filter_31_253]